MRINSKKSATYLLLTFSLCLFFFIFPSVFIKNQTILAVHPFQGSYVVDQYLPENCQESVCFSEAQSCKKKCCLTENCSVVDPSCKEECERIEQSCYQNVFDNLVSEKNRAYGVYNSQNFATLYDCQYSAWYCCYLDLKICIDNCDKLHKDFRDHNDCKEECIISQHVCDNDLKKGCEDVKTDKGQKIDTCKNNIKDEGEENVDCGGPCVPCNYQVEISPSKVDLFADGKSKQDFSVKVTLYGKPVEGMIFDISSRTNPQFLESFDSEGKFAPTKITTNAEGNANFTYSAPLATGKRFKNASSELTLAGRSGGRVYINLKDPRPLIEINLSQRSMLEGNEVNFADIKIKDEDSNKWTIKIDASIGTLMPVGGGRSGEVYSIIDAIDSPEYYFNWNPPKSAVEMVDSYANYSKAYRTDLANLKQGITEEAVQHAIQGIGKYAGGDTEQSIIFGLELKSYYDQYKTWQGNVSQLQEDINQIKSSASVYEVFLRGLSLGTESLRTYWGTKKFVTEKLSKNGEQNIFMDFLEKVSDKTIDYGCDSLRSGLRFLADLERESKTFSWEMQVHIIVEVADEDGFKSTKDAYFNYIYHYNLND